MGGLGWLTSTNALAYHTPELIASVKGAVAQAGKSHGRILSDLKQRLTSGRTLVQGILTVGEGSVQLTSLFC